MIIPAGGAERRDELIEFDRVLVKMGKQSRRREAGATVARALISETAASAALETCKGHGLKNSKITDGDLQLFASIKDMFRGEEQKHLEGIDDSDAKTKSWSRTKIRRVFAANNAIADAFQGTDWSACGGGMMCRAALAEGPLVRDVQFRLRADDSREWSVKINSDMELVADGGCPRKAKAIILGVLDAMKNSDIMPKKCSFCAAPCKNRKCARCKKAVYCSAACQKSAWKTHKAECKPASN